jgi:hypothetical protein
MVGAGDWVALETGWRWRPVGAEDWLALETGWRWRPTILQRLDFSGRYISRATLFLWPLHFSGLYFSRATTSLWPLPFKRLGVLHCMESYGHC